MKLTDYLGDKPFWKVTVRLAVPVALQNVLTSSFQLVDTLMVSRLGEMIVKRAGLKYKTPLQSLNDEQLLACVKIAKWFTLAVEGVMGFDSAQVTAGGVSTREFDARTLESTISPGLFVCGEVLDIDGDCGGFNLQWAWSSGYLAGRLGEGD